ncbi:MULTISPECIES: hypothetical protein [Pseudomonas fluorescens group]
MQESTALLPPLKTSNTMSNAHGKNVGFPSNFKDALSWKAFFRQ